MRTCVCGVATATGDTVETSIGAVTLPSNAKRIVAVGVSLNASGLTTLEGASGIFRISINNIDVTPGQFPISGPGLNGTDSGWIFPLRMWNVDWGPAGNSVVSCWVTMDMANTINPTARLVVEYEK